MIDTETQDSKHDENVGKMDTNEVMKEDGLRDVENMYTEQLNSFYYTKGDTYTEENKNTNKGTQVLKTPKYVSMMDSCIYTIELPVSEHSRLEVKVAKKAEIKNLQD